jgi:hypothetical protein
LDLGLQPPTLPSQSPPPLAPPEALPADLADRSLLWEGGLFLDPRDGGNWKRLLPRLASEWAAAAAFRALPTNEIRLRNLAGRPVSLFAPCGSAYASPFAPPGVSNEHVAAAALRFGCSGRDDGDGGSRGSRGPNPLLRGTSGDEATSTSGVAAAALTRLTSGMAAGLFAKKGASNGGGGGSAQAKRRLPSDVEASLLGRFQELAATPVS